MCSLRLESDFAFAVSRSIPLRIAEHSKLHCRNAGTYGTLCLFGSARSMLAYVHMSYYLSRGDMDLIHVKTASACGQCSSLNSPL
jgi:hypothetical protein